MNYFDDDGPTVLTYPSSDGQSASAGPGAFAVNAQDIRRRPEQVGSASQFDHYSCSDPSMDGENSVAQPPPAHHINTSGAQNQQSSNAYARNRQIPVGDDYYSNSERRSSRRNDSTRGIVSMPSVATTDTVTAFPGAVAVSGHPEGGTNSATMMAGNAGGGSGGGGDGGGGNFVRPSNNHAADQGQGTSSTTIASSPPPPTYTMESPTSSTRNASDSTLSLPIASAVVSDTSNSRGARGLSFLYNESRQGDVATRIVNSLRQQVENQVRQQFLHQQQQLQQQGATGSFQGTNTVASYLSNQQHHTTTDSADHDRNTNHRTDGSNDDDDNKDEECCATVSTCSPCAFAAILIGFILIGALLGTLILIAVGMGDDSPSPSTIEGDNNEKENIDKDMDEQLNPTTIIAMVPSESPTSHPTDLEEPPSPSPTSVPTRLERFDELWSIIGELITINGHLILEDETSIQHQAFSWLVDDDPAQLDFDDENPIELLERYVLAVLYLSTRGPSTWTHKFDFLSSSHVCTWNALVDDESNLRVLKGVQCDLLYVTSLDLGT